ncbi:zinc finger and SCAN domain-containing protein 22-like [Littorina saxatilis]|uniref:zinc finger and SCAN domain-containing protein 22-like n=1 Tax=Littorina saxatilis TaxID=31220 RepID=UPI0038B64180
MSGEGTRSSDQTHDQTGGRVQPGHLSQFFPTLSAILLRNNVNNGCRKLIPGSLPPLGMPLPVRYVSTPQLQPQKPHQQSEDRSQVRRTVRGCDRLEEKKTEVTTERDTQERLLVRLLRLPVPQCMTGQHSQEPEVKAEVKIEIDVAEEPPLAWCMTQQHSHETEVKIEIDVAEEPQQHSQVSVQADFTTESTASIMKEQTTKTQAEFFDQCSSSQESVKHHNRQVSEHIKSESRDAEDTTVVTGDTQFIPTHQDEGAGAESSAMARDDTAQLTRSPCNSQSPSSQDDLSSEESSTGLDHLTIRRSNSLKGESLQKEMRTQAENSTGQNKRERGHKTPKGNSCTQCNASFRRLHDLKQHVVTHTDVRPHRCAQCNSSFCYPSQLKRHMFTHTGEKPYSCAQCSASFNRPSVLKHHMFTHTGERPYRCTHCSASFALHAVLKRHMFTHTGERPYRCTHCSASFALHAVLKRHLIIHTGERPHRCTQCSASFTRPSTLKRHMETHTG